MQVVPFYDLLCIYQIPGMSRNKSGIHVSQEYSMYYHVSSRDQDIRSSFPLSW